MKILHIDCGRSWRGGQNQVLLLTAELTARGVTSLVLTPPGSPLTLKLTAAGLLYHNLPLRGEIDLKSAYQIRRLARSGGYDLIHCHDAHSITLAHLSNLGFSPALPVIATRRVDFAINSPWKYQQLDRIVAISTAISRIIGYSVPRPVSIIPSGVKSPPVRRPTGWLHRELGLPAQTKLVAQVGSLVDHKDPLNFIAAAKILKPHANIHFLLIGDGPLADAAGKAAAGLPLSLLGFRPDVPHILPELTCFVIASQMEGLCTSILDAMAAGVPVVATDAGGIPDIVRNKETGLQVPVRDHAALAAAILAQVEHRERAMAMAIAARQMVKEEFSVQQMASRYLKLYKAILAR